MFYTLFNNFSRNYAKSLTNVLVLGSFTGTVSCNWKFYRFLYSTSNVNDTRISALGAYDYTVVVVVFFFLLFFGPTQAGFDEYMSPVRRVGGE